MAVGQMQTFDHEIRELKTKTTKASMTNEIGGYEATLIGLRSMINAKKIELECVDKKIVAKENGKKALLSFVEALGDSNGSRGL
jgi:hypothetical protein